MTTIKRFMLVFVIVLACSLPALGAEHRVTTKDELISAINSAASGDIITLAGGTYTLSNDKIEISKALTIRSTEGAVIDGQDNPYSFQDSLNITADTVLDGLTITRFKSSFHSIQVSSANLKINNCVISRNLAILSILHVKNGRMEVTNSTIADNEAALGFGTLYATKNGTAILNNCTLVNNLTHGDIQNFGAHNIILNEKSSVTLTNCTISSYADHQYYNRHPDFSVSDGCKLDLINTIVRTKSASPVYIYTGGSISYTNCALPSSMSGGTDSVTLSWENAVSSDVKVDGVTHTVFMPNRNPELVTLANKGKSSGAPEKDQIGNERGISPTIGAIEYIRGLVFTSEELVNAVNNNYDLEITLAEGTYELSEELLITRPMTIKSTKGAVLKGTGNHRVIHSNSAGSVTLEGLTITGGNAGDSNGGGIYVSRANSQFTAKNCNISGNYAKSGGGVFCDTDTEVTLTNCTIANNSASNGGGGVSAYNHANAFLTNCTITGNKSQQGGAIYSESGTVGATNCTIVNNSASEDSKEVTLYTDESLNAYFRNTLIWNSASSDVIDSGSFTVYYTNCALQSDSVRGTDTFVLTSWPNPVSSNAKAGGVTHTVFSFEDNLEIGGLAGRGTRNGAPVTDQLGFKRPYAISIGAVEVRSSGGGDDGMEGETDDGSESARVAGSSGGGCDSGMSLLALGFVALLLRKK